MLELRVLLSLQIPISSSFINFSSMMFCLWMRPFATLNEELLFVSNIPLWQLPVSIWCFCTIKLLNDDTTVLFFLEFILGLYDWILLRLIALLSFVWSRNSFPLSLSLTSNISSCTVLYRNKLIFLLFLHKMYLILWATPLFSGFPYTVFSL